MEFPLRIFACVLTVFGTLEFIAPSVGFSLVAFTKNITTTGWSDIEDRLGPSLNRTHLEKQTKILAKIHKVENIVKGAEGIVEAIDPMKIMDVIESITVGSNIRHSFRSLLDSIEQIDADYNDMRIYARSPMNSRTLEDLTHNIVSHGDYSVKRLGMKIHNLLVPKRGIGLFAMFDRYNANLNEQVVYQLEQSPRQFFYNLYSLIALTQIKVYAMMQLSYQLLEISERTPYTNEANMAKNDFRRRSKEAVDEAKRVLQKLSTHFWRSDPQKYEKGLNYLEITRLGQGYIVDEKTLKKGDTCHYNCEEHQEVTIRTYLDDNLYRRSSRCNGQVYGCKDLTYSNIYVCPADTYSSRRYHYIETQTEIMGKKTFCPVRPYRVEGRRDTCNYCVCLCDESGPLSDRYFSLRQAVSDIKRNRVVTGLKFVKKNKMIHLQVQQGELLPYGAIDSDTLEWVPVDEFRISDRYVYNKQDYFKLDWKNRAIDLHVLPNLPNDLGDVLLTGVRFKTIDSNTRGALAHLNLEIRVTRFHFQSGKLYTKQANTWIDNLSTQFSFTNRRTEIILGEVDVSTKASKNEPSSDGNQYVKFTHTAYDKDAAQTTVPFIDSQDVAPSVPTPLVGAGLYFKGQKGFGGFLSLKIVTYDFTKHL